MKKFIVLGLQFILSQTYAADFKVMADNALNLTKALVDVAPVTGKEAATMPIIQARLAQLGLDYEFIKSEDDRPNYVIRLKAPGSTKKAMLLMAHLDVVSAAGQKWVESPNPHEMIISNGFAYGRGVIDMLGYASVAIEIMGELKQKNVKLERDLILMLTSDEEKGGFKGVGWLLKNRPDLFKNIEFVVTEGGSVLVDSAQKPLFIGFSGAEKTYQDYRINVTGPSGHSSTPPKHTAINLIVQALAKVNKMQGIPRLIPLVKSYFTERAKVESDPKLKLVLHALSTAPINKDLSNTHKLAIQLLEEKYPALNAILRRTCVATVISGGNPEAKNALAPIATANVNCRLMPDEDLNAFTEELKKVVTIKAAKEGDPTVEVIPDPAFQHGPPSPASGPVPDALRSLAQSYFQGIPVIPSMLTGGTDSRYLRMMGIPSYGIGPILISDRERLRAHGLDERFLVNNLPGGIEFFYRMVLMLVAPDSRNPAAEITFDQKPSQNFKEAFESEKSHSGPQCSH